MSSRRNTVATPIPPPTSWQRHVPALTLAVLSPVIAEVLNGSTRLSFLIVLIPEILFWGLGALLARELVRRWRAGWTSLLLLGLALSVAEEFVVQQTSLAPLPWLGAVPTPDRVWSVNWLYFLFMLVYESLWVVLVPVQLVELLFPARRREPWLRRGGLFLSTVLFFLGAFIAWFTWTQQARPNVFHVAKYAPPPIALLAGIVAIILLIVFAYTKRGAIDVAQSSTGSAPQPWLVVLVVLLIGFPWF